MAEKERRRTIYRVVQKKKLAAKDQVALCETLETVAARSQGNSV